MTDQTYPPDDLDTRRRRARYRAGHRGTKELDLILGPFAAAHLGTFNGAQLEHFEDLLDEEETELQALLVAEAPMPAGRFSDLIAEIRTFQISRVKREAEVDNG